MNFKIIFYLDGSGVLYDTFEPIHLDSLLGFAVAPMQAQREIDRVSTPDDIKIPLLRTKVDGYDVWRGSALLPEGETVDTLRFWRKKFRVSRLGQVNQSVNLQSGSYREYNTPVALVLCHRLIAYGRGDSNLCVKILKRNIKALGKKRSQGYGRIIEIESHEIDNDFSFVKDGLAMRWLPMESGFRRCRVSPPYWNSVNVINVCEIGDEYQL